eukprot:1187008-Prorocentrum_minimum.AAC.1
MSVSSTTSHARAFSGVAGGHGSRPAGGGGAGALFVRIRRGGSAVIYIRLSDSVRTRFTEAERTIESVVRALASTLAGSPAPPPNRLSRAWRLCLTRVAARRGLNVRRIRAPKSPRSGSTFAGVCR